MSETPLFDATETDTDIDADQTETPADPQPEPSETSQEEAAREAAVDPTQYDWSLTTNPRVQAVSIQAVNSVAAEFAAVTTGDDMSQEAAILIASNAPTVNNYLMDTLIGDRNLYRWLRTHLRDLVRTDQARANLNVALPVGE